jgi:uncharacterized membrane protein YkoI
MQISRSRLITAVVQITAVAILTGACSSTKANKEVPVTMSELSPPASATVAKVTAGGHVEKIHREIERGKPVYDVEATVDGKHMEYLIAESDGAVLGTEVPIAFSELPATVQKSAETFFGTTSALTAMKGVEYGETQYEIEGLKNGKRVEVTFDPEGKQEN